MPEIKNTFLKSKMNKDLDSRLIPNGEYRDAKNLSVSRSEGADVGSLENILGNTIISDLKNKIKNLEAEKLQEYWTGSTVTPTEIQTNQLEIIGYYSAVSIDTLFLFITDYRDSSNDRLSNFASSDISTSPPGPQFVAKGAMCYIVQFNLISNESRVLVGGSFLNFSKTHPILNVNLLEDLLFWTDNRNQPRKINIKKAALTGNFNGSWETWSGSKTNNPYYYSEDHVSVAKFAPYECFKFIDSSDNNTLISNSEEFLPAHIITSVSQSVPASNLTIKINGNYVLLGNNPDIVGDSSSPHGNADKLTVYIDDVYYNYLISSVQINGSDTDIILTEALNGASNPNFPSGGLSVSNSVILISRKNPDYDQTYRGDTNLLRDKFTKFSYRFKYDDDEYSLMAPFTQAAFVPKQFGYFIDNDEEITLQSGNVKFMENRVDEVKLNLTLPFNGNEIEDKLKVKEVQILIKNSDELAVRVVEDIEVSRLGTTTNYEYSYLSTKAIKTLPEADLIRVHDKIPVRALTQEIISNRIVYGNYLDKHTSPISLNYELNYNSKSINPPNNKTAIEFPNHTLKQNRSYQVGVVLVDRYGRTSNVILNNSDNVGTAKNSTIYADYISETNPAFTNFFGKKLEFNLRSPIPESDSRPNYPGLYSETNPLGYYSYRIVVKQQEQEYYNVYTPGALAGELVWDTTVSNAIDLKVYDSTTAPPSGVTANIQDYLPSFHSKNRITLLNLFGDNINKVPRELQEVNGNDTTFDSRVLLYNRVNPIYSSNNGSYNTQSNVSKRGEKVVSIEPFKELGNWTTTKGVLFPYSEPNKKHDIPQPFYPYFVTTDNQGNPPDYEYNFYDIFFNSSANPFIAKIETDFIIGATPAYTTIPVDTTTSTAASDIATAKTNIERAWQDLGVFETEPTKSVLDIYYESSTSGLIEDFNLAASDAVPGGISDGTNSTALGQNIQYIHTEDLDSSIASPKDATLTLNLTDSAGGVITSSFTAEILQVLDGNNNNRNSDFTITQPTTSTFKIQSTSKQVFLSDSSVRENYTFNLMFTDTSNPSQPLWTGPFPLQLSNCQLQNIAPSFATQPSSIYNVEIDSSFATSATIFNIVTGTASAGEVKAVNGSSNAARNTEELVYEIVDAVNTNPNAGAADFKIDQDSTGGIYLGTVSNFWNLYPPSFINQTAFVSNGDFLYDLKLKVTDANGNGISKLSNSFQVRIITTF
jgi:hypothetical protein